MARGLYYEMISVSMSRGTHFLSASLVCWSVTLLNFDICTVPGVSDHAQADGEEVKGHHGRGEVHRDLRTISDRHGIE